MSSARSRTREPDQACAEAVDLARAAVTDVVGAGLVGEHLEAQAEGERIVTHLFACEDPAYSGWRWAVTVVRAPRAKAVTVSEIVLLPGPASLLAPDWVPWRTGCGPETSVSATCCLPRRTTKGSRRWSCWKATMP